MAFRRSSAKLCFAAILLTFVLSSCGSAPSPQPVEIITSKIGEKSTLTLVPTHTPTAVPTATNTSTPLPTATPLPKASVIADTKVRTGPAVAFPVMATIPTGDNFSIVSRNMDSSWILIEINEIQGWVSTEEILVDEINSIAGLPIIEDFSEPPLAITGWKGDPVSRVCIDVKPKYSGNYASEHKEEIPNPEPMYMTAASILVEAGLEPSSGDDCDATLLIETDINQTGKKYVQSGTKNVFFCFDGVNVNSSLTLLQDDLKFVKKTNKNRGSRNSLTSCASSSAYVTEAEWSVADGMYKLWGPEILPAALKSMSSAAKDFAVLTIGTLGKKGLSYVPDLLDIMQSDSSYLEQSGVSLKKVTGQNFGSDTNAWVDWWLTQDPSYSFAYIQNVSPSTVSLPEAPANQPQNLPEAPVATARPTPVYNRNPTSNLAEVITGEVKGNAAGSEGITVSLVGYTAEYGYDVVGEVKNNSGKPIDLIKVDVSLYDAAGVLLTQDYIYTVPYKIDHGSAGGFEWEYQGVSGVAKIEATGVSYFSAKEYKTSFTVVSDTMVRAESFMTVSGQAKNTGSSSTKSAQVIVYYYDTSDRLIYVDSQTFYGTDIPAGGLIDYKIMTKELIPVDHYVVVAECTE